jgi:hypothetical protein
MVELKVVETSNFQPPSRPIGVFQSIMAGFDKIAAQPLLILPPILLDLFLWLGPRLTINSIVQDLLELVVAPPGSDQAMIEQINLFQSLTNDLGQRLNLFAMVSTLPAGISSLMTSRMPVLTPLGQTAEIPIQSFVIVFVILFGLLVIGQGLGAQFHIWIARQLAKGEELANHWRAGLRMIVLAILLYVAVILFGLGISFVASLFTFVSMAFGIIIAFLGFTFGFWVFVYLFFTPHGIVRYKLGVVRAMLESATLVRWNLLPVVGYLGASFVISWLTSQAWILPTEDSWFLLLAILGHAFVSATLLAGSYAFYQDRREWMYAVQKSQIISSEQGEERRS